MSRCAALKSDGSRCQARAMEGYQWCYSHRPDLAEERSRNARRGGKAGGRGRGGLSETTEAKRYIKALVNKLIKGEIERGIAATCFMGLNTLGRFIELELKVREQEEIIERLEALEQDMLSQSNSRRWTFGG